MTRALVVYESVFGNTAAVASAVAEGLSGGVRTSLVEVSSAPHELPPDVALVVVGGPTHAFGMTRTGTRSEAVRRARNAGARVAPRPVGIREWLGDLRGVSRAAFAATFDTRIARPRLPGSAARAARRRLRARGLAVLVPAQTFFVHDVQGPLLDGELDRARDWGTQLAMRLATEKELTP